MNRINFSVGNTWKYNYEGNEIVVKDTLGSYELWVNGKMQDVKRGLFMSADLNGLLPNGRLFKATVGGVINAKCSVIVNYQVLEPVNSHCI